MCRFVALLIFLCSLCAPVTATPQIPEQIEISGEELPLYSFPLHSVVYEWDRNKRWAKRLGKNPCSGAWRGYRAAWKIEQGRLFLLEVHEACSSPPKPVRISKLFGWGQKPPILADWFSGELVIPRGKITNPIGRNFWPEYEEYELIDIEAGVIVESRIIPGAEFLSRVPKDER
jgi:hypothetical protein